MENQSSFTAVPAREYPTLEQQIRQIVREEIAAQFGRLLAETEVKKVEGIVIDDIYRDDNWRKINPSP